MIPACCPTDRARRPRPGRGGGWFVLIGLLGLGGGPGAHGAETGVSQEYQIKAAFLYNFTKFVEWPAERFVNATSPIVIGVVGKNPFEGELAKIAATRTVNGRAIVIRQYQSAGDAGAAHAVFVATGEEKRCGRELDSLIHGGVLIVGESAEMTARGCTVTFTTAGDKVRFEINMISADRGELKISSQLQKLATVVRRNP